MMDNGQYLKTQGMGFNLWNEEFMQGRAAQVRFTVIDGVVTLYMKFAGEQDWGQPQFEYDLGYTPSGYIRIFTYGETSVTDLGLAYNSAANFKIDNFALENKDYEGVRNLIDEPPFKTNVIAATLDYEYIDRTDPEDLLSNRLENGEAEMVASGCSSAIPAVSVAGAAGLMTVSALCVRRKKR